MESSARSSFPLVPVFVQNNPKLSFVSNKANDSISAKSLSSIGRRVYVLIGRWLFEAD